MLRASRPPAPAVHSGGPNLTVDALHCAAVLNAGADLDAGFLGGRTARAMGLPAVLLASLNSDNRQRAMEAGHRLSDLSMVDIAAAALRADGRDVPVGRSEILAAATGSGTLANVFTTGQQVGFLRGYEEVEDTTVGWTREVEVSNFKENERNGMKAGGTDLAKLPRGGTAESADREDKGERFKIHRYAKTWSIDEQDMIDDDRSLLGDVQMEFGKAARRVRPDLVYSELLRNPTLRQDGVAVFAAGHGNDHALPLNAANLKTALTAFKLQRENGVNLNLRPDYIIGPPDLEFSILQLLSSMEVRGDDAANGTANVLRNRLRNVVCESRLENGVTDPDTGTEYAGDPATWYLASSRAETILVAYLRGSGKAPKTRRAPLPIGSFGWKWDVKLDVGVAATDFRGLARSAG